VFNVPFQHKYMAISGMKGKGWRVIPTQYTKTSDILNSTLAAFLFSSDPKRERDREAHFNYYTSADNRERQRILTPQLCIQKMGHVSKTTPLLAVICRPFGKT